MKLSQFINEYDYLGKTYDGYEFRVWENPAISEMESEMNNLTIDKDSYLRGYLADDGTVYVSSYGSHDHADLKDFLVNKIGIKKQMVATGLFENGTMKVYQKFNHDRDTLQEWIDKSKKINGWRFSIGFEL